MPDISMCNQDCPVRFNCKRHSASGTLASDYQCYTIFTVPPLGDPDKCDGWWPNQPKRLTIKGED